MTVLKTADLNFGTIVASIVRNQLNRTVSMAPYLEVRRGKNASGPVWNFETSGATSATHAIGAAYPTAAQDTNLQASLNWGRYHESFEIADETLSDGAMMHNPEAYTSEFLRQLQTAVGVMAKKVEHDSFSGSDTTNGIIGYDSAIADGNTYANVIRGSVTAWQSYVKAAGSLTTLSKDNLLAFLAQIGDNCGELPTHCFLSHQTLNKVKSLFDSNIVFNVPGFDYIGTGRMPVQIEGVVFVPVGSADGYGGSTTANNGRIYAVNSNYVHYEVKPYLNDGKKVIVDNLPFGMQVVADPTGAHSSRAVVRNVIQLVVEKPVACGVFKDINIA